MLSTHRAICATLTTKKDGRARAQVSPFRAAERAAPLAKSRDLWVMR